MRAGDVGWERWWPSTPPGDACSIYRALYAKLEAFEADLHRHVHLETNVLFPRFFEAIGQDREGRG